MTPRELNSAAGTDMQQRPAAVIAAAQGLADQLDAKSLDTFGRYYEQLEGRLKELRESFEGGLARSRQSTMERVEELAGALHRDMMTLRQEQQRELEDLKRDVFTAVMSLSAVNDRITAAENRAEQQIQRLQETVAVLAHRTAPDLLRRNS
jgi:exonuclease VII large subunit